MPLRGAILTSLLLLAVACFQTMGQDKKPDEAPRLLLSSPLGVTAGVASKVVLRGLRLDQVSEVRVGEPPVSVKILSKGKVGVPQKQDVNRVGDSQIEVEIELPKDAKSGEIAVTVVAPSGTSIVHQLFVDALPLVAEKEPNDGFRQAQPIAVPQIVDGTIHANQNVDVFRFSGTLGQRVTIDLTAAKHGSLLDPILTIYNADGRVVAAQDDQHVGRDAAQRRDPHAELTLPATGAYYVVIQDAHDRGTTLHPYRLTVQATK